MIWKSSISKFHLRGSSSLLGSRGSSGRAAKGAEVYGKNVTQLWPQIPMGSLNKMEPQVLLTDKLLRIFLSFKSWTLTWWSWNKQEMSSWNGWNLQISHRCPSGRIRMLTSQIHSQGLTEKLMGPCFLDKVAIPKVQYIYVYIYILIYIYILKI